MGLDGRLNVSHQDLEAGPEGAQGVDERLGRALRFVHVDVLEHVTVGAQDPLHDGAVVSLPPVQVLVFTQ